MFEGKSVAVVVPCYNEETQVDRVITSMPLFVDSIIVVDDASTDATADVIRRRMEQDGAKSRVTLVPLDANRGVGAAIVAGYKEAIRRRIDITAVMAGDGQMDPDQLELLVGPVARGTADYAKANRLFYENSWNSIPRHRYLGNAFLSMLTKIASGYWHVADSQTGYTAIARETLELLDLDAVYPRYGYPNDMLVRLNVFDGRVADVHMRPVYNVGERSKMKLWKVVPTMTWLIFTLFCWRMKEKYVIRDFHPLVLFYLTAGTTGLLGFAFFVRLVVMWILTGAIPQINALVWAFCLISSMQFALFAMWFDMDRNRHLNPQTRRP
ncbi:MAG: glycosyltransferase family 2 protein [Planctomycetes bacterium]|nr:glycosyltransferase family 2 protein [Planctomycetota bacterium]